MSPFALNFSLSICHLSVEERKIVYSRTEGSDDWDCEMEDRGELRCLKNLVVTCNSKMLYEVKPIKSEN